MLPNIFWSRTDYISGAYATKMVAISSPERNWGNSSDLGGQSPDQAECMRVLLKQN